MQRIETIEGVRNLKSGKLFVLVDDKGALLQVINPQGEILNLPVGLFDEDPIIVSSDEFATQFTAEQVETLKTFNQQAAARAENEKQQLSAPPPTQRPQPPRPNSSAGSGPVKRPRSTKPAPSHYRMPPVTWSGTKLIFYRHKIQPLGPYQTMRIDVEDVGSFELTKEDFLAYFNDVVMTPSYQREGLFSYPEIPEKAKRFLKPPQG
jgi:hypothetical protein